MLKIGWFSKEPKGKMYDVHTNEGELEEWCLFAGHLNGCPEPGWSFYFFTLPTYTNNPQIEGKYGIRPHILYVENPNSRQFQQRIQK